MKFSVLVETKRKVKNSWKDAGVTEYIVKIPNYLRIDTDTLISAVKKKVEKTVIGEESKVVSHRMYSDTTLTEFEKKQIDLSGKVSKPVEISLDKLDLEE